MQYFRSLSSLDKCQLEAVGGVFFGTFVGQIILDKHVKLRDPSLNRSREILPEVVGGGIFDSVFAMRRFEAFRLKTVLLPSLNGVF